MDRNEAINRVARLLGDYDFRLLDINSYNDALDYAIFDYYNIYPAKSFTEVSVDFMQDNNMIDITNILTHWTPKFSVVEGIEIVRPEGYSGLVPVSYRNVYFRKNSYAVIEDEDNGKVYFRLNIPFRGRIRIYYTHLPSTGYDFNAIQFSDKLAVVYLGAFYAGYMAASRLSQYYENIIDADKLKYENKAKNLMQIAEKYKQQAYNLLNIPVEGVVPYGDFMEVPYIDRRRAVRRM